MANYNLMAAGNNYGTVCVAITITLALYSCKVKFYYAQVLWIPANVIILIILIIRYPIRQRRLKACGSTESETCSLETLLNAEKIPEQVVT